MKLGNLRFRDYGSILPFDCVGTDEECAVLLGAKLPGMNGLVFVYRGLKVPNRADRPDQHFKIMTEDVPADVLPFVVGVAHTHTKPCEVNVSYDDIAHLKGTDFLGLMLHPRTNTVKLYDESGWIATGSWEGRGR